jgi:peptide/nickel transport system ATP-binding protein/oligopeptide transport system ATP-binding protein
MTGVGPPLVETRALTKEFPVGSSLTRALMRKPRDVLVAVDDVSLTIQRGETLGVVGESGSGKSTLGRLLLQLERPTSGDILFDGASIIDASGTARRQLRKRVQVVFQDPYSSLNPTMTVRQMLAEVLSVHHIGTKDTRAARIDDLLERVGLSPTLGNRRPRQFSGGQRQRVGIARALAVEPEFVVADEAVSALDVSIQAQVLNLLMRLQDDLGLTYLFISHNLSVARHISNSIAVMYLGRIVELAPTEALFAEPLHPYTQALFRAAPKPIPRRKTITPVITGDIPNPIDRPRGCHFHPRCPFVMDICREEYPTARAPTASRMVKCHLYDSSGV